MIDGQSSNATVTILEEADSDGTTDEDWTPYDDVDSGSDDWDPVHKDVPCRYEPRGSAFVTEGSGDAAYREERILTPLRLSDDIPHSTRVEINYRGQTLKRRVVDPRPRSIDGVEGYCEIELEDWGDQ